MTDQQWQQAWEIFRTARELSDDQRRSYLSSVSVDPEVFEQIIVLINDPAGQAPAISDLKPGTRFGRYEVTGKLGRGGMGQVYSARDTELGRKLALKLLAPELTASPRAMERLIREARAASALNHPHIVTVYEVVHSGDDVAIAMELVEGDALRSYCGQPQPAAKVIQWGRQIAQALAAAHAQNIVHRDIKPENLMVRPDGYAKVLDFGLAGQFAAGEQRRDGETQWSNSSGPLSNFSNFSGTLGGTLNYMAPEQTGAEPATSASDVFSLGIVLYELVTGTHPFLCDSPLDTAQAIANADPKPPSALNRGIPLAFNSLLLAMLAKNPDARPSAAEVDRRLSATEAATEKRQSRRFRWLIALCTACIVAAVALWLMKDRIFPPKQPVLVQVTTRTNESRVTAAALSPDGTRLAFATLDGSVYLRNMKDGVNRPLSTLTGLQVDRIAWFSDSTKLVASGFSLQTNVSSIWIVAANGARPWMLRDQAREASPSPDGTKVAFISQDWSEVWVIGVNGDQPRRIASGHPENTYQLVFWSPDSKRVNFQTRYAADGVTAYESILLATEKTEVESQNIRMKSASALADGRILFLQPDSPNSGAPDQLWEMKTDLKTGRLLGAPHRIASLADQHPMAAYGISSTADGKQVTVVRASSRGAVFVGDIHEQPPRITHIQRLTPDEGFNDYPHAWTADSRAVILESNRHSISHYDLFEQTIGEPTAKTISATRLTEMLAQLGPDNWLLYAARDDEGGLRDFKLMRIPMQGGAPEEVPIGGPLDEFRCALQTGKRCVLRTTVRGEYYIYYDLDPVRGKGRELARTKWTPEFLGDWDVSPDGTQVAIPDHDSEEPRIRVIALEPRRNEAREHEVVVPGQLDIHGLVWAANGLGWFVSVRTTFDYRMIYVYPDGHFYPLGDIQGWAVPSPNGQRVAFWNHTVATNAWLAKLH